MKLFSQGHKQYVYCWILNTGLSDSKLITFSIKVHFPSTGKREAGLFGGEDESDSECNHDIRHGPDGNSHYSQVLSPTNFQTLL
jgi:hypothetical protein